MEGIGGGGGNIPPYNGIKDKESADGGTFVHSFILFSEGGSNLLMKMRCELKSLRREFEPEAQQGLQYSQVQALQADLRSLNRKVA